jgi:hypothetical protein
MKTLQPFDRAAGGCPTKKQCTTGVMHCKSLAMEDERGLENRIDARITPSGACYSPLRLSNYIGRKRLLSTTFCRHCSIAGILLAYF